MARRVPCVPSLLLLLYLLPSGFSSGGALEMIDKPDLLKCSEGLADCSVTAHPYGALLPVAEDTVYIRHLDLKVALCCSDRKDCEPCLQIVLFITVQDLLNKKVVSEQSGDQSNEDESSGNKQTLEGSGQQMLPDPKALVKVCFSSPGSFEHCKAITFRLINTMQEHQPAHKIWLTIKIHFGSVIMVQVYARSKTTHNITIPSLQDVCSLDLDDSVKECDAPRVRAVMDARRGVFLLQLDNTDTATTQEVVMCQMLWDQVSGQLFEWHKGQREMIIPSNSVAPCLCFKVWWKGKSLRRQSCPFKNQQDVFKRMQENVSVSMTEAQMRDDGTALSWNVTAPCRLEGEVWLCKKDSSVEGQCEEVKDSRQRLNNHSHGWSSSRNGHWKKGEFINVSLHPALCLQIKIHGMDSDLEPHCPFATPRWRWSLPLLIISLLICLIILGAYAVQGILKGYMWRWLKEDDIKGAVGGGHVVLLYPPDGDQALPALVCRLGSSLQALGFSVSLDLWTQAELGVLGPVPWLHSRLDRLQRQGGKVVLVLTHTAWERAEEWGSLGWERDAPRERNREAGEGEEPEGGLRAGSPHSDVFSASLSCILADYLQGRAGERFVLVQFESLPPQPPGCSRPLPELFRGLHLFSLPSQSLGFLTELAVRGRRVSASGRQRRAGGLRVASRTLAGGLRGVTAGSTVLRLAGLSQDCVGVEAEDPWETVPLQPCLTTPPSSPDNCPKVNGMEWV